MAISESQLETWSHQGSITQSKNTYATIKAALEDSATPFAARKPVVFLQGSYCNDTNIYNESDVDVVIQLDTCFRKDLEELPDDQRDAFNDAHSDATYTDADFKRDVLSHLQAKFGAAVKPGNKAVKIEANGSRRSADVLIAIQFRRYHRFIALDNQAYDTGSCFYNGAGTLVANYPKQHSENCTTKHQATNSRFKPLVRILKNMRAKLVGDDKLAAGVAPSYYIEGLLYNVPNDKFSGKCGEAFVNSIKWIQNADRSSFVCANEQYDLLREDANVTWSTADYEKFLATVVNLWNQWI
jgi:hypothetical protein